MELYHSPELLGERSGGFRGLTQAGKKGSRRREDPPSRTPLLFLSVSRIKNEQYKRSHEYFVSLPNPAFHCALLKSAAEELFLHKHSLSALLQRATVFHVSLIFRSGLPAEN